MLQSSTQSPIPEINKVIEENTRFKAIIQDLEAEVKRMNEKKIVVIK